MIQFSNKVNNSYLEKTPFYLLIALSLFPIQKYGMISALIIAFCIISLCQIKIAKASFKKLGLKHFLINTLFYFILLSTIFTSDNIESYLKGIQNGISFLVFPLFVFYFTPRLSNKKIDVLLKTFVLANVILVFYWIFFFNEIDFFSDRNIRRVLTRFIFRKPLQQHSYVEWHPSYTGVWLSFSILIIISYMSKIRLLLYKIIAIIVALFFYGTIFLLQARTAFFSITIIATILIFLNTKNKKRRLEAFIFILVVFASIALVIGQNKTLKARYYKSLIALNEENPNKANKRTLINECSVALVKKNIVFGYGVGDVQDLLSACYKSKGYTMFYEKNYNSHNNYVHFLLSGGVLLLLSFIVLILYNIFFAIKNRDYLYMSFLIIITIACLTENILSRIHGILFFSLFNSLMYKRNLILKEPFI